MCFHTEGEDRREWRTGERDRRGKRERARKGKRELNNGRVALTMKQKAGQTNKVLLL